MRLARRAHRGIRMSMAQAELQRAPGAPPSPAPVAVRFHAFDSLRASAMLLGIFFHAAISYLDPPDPGWAANDPSRSPLVGLFLWASHGFRMQVFFLMSGFFAHMLHTRYGARRFAAHRFKRIAIPFALSVIVIIPLVQAAWVFGAVRGAVDAPAAVVAEAVSEMPSFAVLVDALVPAHLWFLEFLLVYSAIALVAAPLLARAPLRSERFDRAFAALMRTPWKPLLLAVPTTAVSYLSSSWVLGGTIDSFIPEWRVVLYYGLFFLFGWWLHRQSDLLEDLLAHRWAYLGLAVLLLATPGLLGWEHAPEGPQRDLIRFLVLSLSSLYTWLVVFGLMGVFLRAFRRESALARYVSDSAYWLYLAHLPLVAALQVVSAGVSAPGILKYLALNGVALLVLFSSYEYLIRYSFVGALLNGRKYRPTR